MSGFEVGMVVMGAIWVINETTKNIMNKVHKHNMVEMDRLKIPIYPIVSWIKFKMKLRKEKQEREQENDNGINNGLTDYEK